MHIPLWPCSSLWTVMVEKVPVHKDGQLTFRFCNSSEICIGACFVSFGCTNGIRTKYAGGTVRCLP